MPKNPTSGVLFVISGPSGVGKGTICQRLIAQNSNLVCSVSATTRSPRQGEVNGVNYFFISEEEFLSQIDKNCFLEWAEVFGNYYGTPKAEVEALLDQGKDVILEIDVQGAMQVKTACPEGVFVFILPPGLEELKKRITLRGSETKESLLCRVNKAEAEMALADQYHFKVVNDDLETAVARVEALIAKVKQVKDAGRDIKQLDF